MLRKIAVVWSAYTLGFISVKLLALLFSGAFRNEYTCVSIMVITSILIIVAGGLLLGEFLKPTQSSEERKEKKEE